MRFSFPQNATIPQFGMHFPSGQEKKSELLFFRRKVAKQRCPKKSGEGGFGKEKCGQLQISSFAQNLPVVAQNIGPYSSGSHCEIPLVYNSSNLPDALYSLSLMLMHFCCLQTLEMLEKKEHVLQKKISVEIGRAKKFTQSKNKKGGS